MPIQVGYFPTLAIKSQLGRDGRRTSRENRQLQLRHVPVLRRHCSLRKRNPGSIQFPRGRRNHGDEIRSSAVTEPGPEGTPSASGPCHSARVSRQKLTTLFRGLRREKVALSGNSLRVFLVLRRGRILLGGLSWRSWRLGAKSFFESVDDAGDSVFNPDDVEVDEQPQSLISQLQIGEKLLLVHRRDGLDSLDFHDPQVLYHHVCVKPSMDADLLVDHRDALLPSDAQPGGLRGGPHPC